MISNFTCLKAIDMKIHRPLQCNFVIIWRSESENYWTRASDHCILEVLVQAMEHFKKARERQRNVLFNDALNTFYLRLYGVRHMVKDYSDSEKGNPLPPHRLLLSINSKGSFICTIPQTG